MMGVKDGWGYVKDNDVVAASALMVELGVIARRRYGNKQ